MKSYLFLMIGAVLAAFTLTTPASADTGPAPAPACDAAKAEVVSVADLATRPADFAGRCVAVEGVRFGTLLYAGNAALYARPLRYNEPASTGVIVGVESLNRDAPAQFVWIIGRLVDCADIQAQNAASAAGSSIIFSGYCHGHRGPVLTVIEERVIADRRVVRRTRADLPAEAGDLAPLAPGAARAALDGAARTLIAALASRDADRIAAVLRARPGHILQNGADGYASAVAAQVETVLTSDALRVSDPAALMLELFGWREQRWADAETVAANQAAMARETEGYACWSAVADAAARWPVAEFDTGISDARAYACARILIRADGTTEYELAFDGDAALPER